MNIDISILESDSQIRGLILNAIQDHMNIVLNKAIGSIRDEIKNIVSEALKREPEYASLTSGSLRYELGIYDISSVDTVIDLMVDTLDIQRTAININNFGLTGGYNLTMIKSDDINGIIKNEAAMVNDQERGYSLPWLDWLLFQANKPIVKNYEVKFGPNKSSRTGMAIMVESNKNWRVPPEFAGTVTNNWTTRAIEKTEKAILKIMQENIEKNI